ncbi:hypothetical protein Despr_2445 [Desulfobulbus propionicus DSM 2032]|uniref:ABC transporter Uup C-terminal domain-containing protein n=1 Tax=Desulfobulbus propionicus (strain ATCC 33891 / DSM 2032 / VKM B-1956 / 1pr3) TaxID=577650 RepID=A0A7U3YNF0_DESPD|nr:hypothetical protein [Desulfobulbus propionicus]ADW18584.1 hypothetical protein Despr_2445 [Desulfobulbus propionicus DSM 2032]
MLDNERLTRRGLLAEKEQRLRQLESSMQGDIHAVRLALEPFAPLHEIRPDQAAAQAVELAGKHAEYMGLREEIAALKRALGMAGN